MELQEIVTRGRLLFSSAPKRLEVFRLVNGRRSAKEISKKCGKPYVPTLNDLQKMKDAGLLEIKKDENGNILKKNRSLVYEKVPLVKHLSISYFTDSTKISKEIVKGKTLSKKSKNKSIGKIAIPNEKEILDICKTGEDQLYEFKSAGTEVQKLTKEISAFANTKLGGIIFYGVDDDGTISGTDKKKQQLDQPLQNSIKNSISPSIVIDLQEKDVLGQKIILLCIPSWNRKDVYQYDGRVHIRKGTNVFIATPEESKKLHRGEHVI